MSDKRFDDLFKQSFGGYSPDVPPHIWENIAAERKKKRPAGFWLNEKKLISIVAGLALLIGGTYIIYNKKDNTQNIAHENNGSRQENVNTNPAAVLQNNNTVNSTASKGNNDVVTNTENKPSTTNNKTTGSGSDKLLANTNTDISDDDLPGKKINGQSKKKVIHPAKEKFASAKARSNHKIMVDTQEPGVIETGANFSDTEEGLAVLGIDGFRDKINLTTENKLPKPTLPVFTPAIKISEECPGAPTNKYYIDAYISPDYAIKKYTDTGVSTLVAKRKESLRFHSAYSAGLRYTRVFNNGMSIRTGLNFSQINEKFSYAQDNVVQIVYVINTQGDTTDRYYVSGTRYKTSYNNYRTIDVPLVVGYEMGNDKLRANINAGAVINIYSWQSGETLDKDGNPVVITTGKTDNPYQYKTNVGVGFTAGASLYYRLNNRLYAMAEPYFRYNFSPMNKEVLSIQEKFTTIGLRLGIRVDIK